MQNYLNGESEENWILILILMILLASPHLVLDEGYYCVGYLSKLVLPWAVQVCLFCFIANVIS